MASQKKPAEEETCEDSLRSSRSPAVRREPHLFLLLHCDHPSRAAWRYGLAGIDKVRLGRGDATQAHIERAGQSRSINVAIADRHISSRHAQVERAGQSFVVFDAGSRNGTWVNGRRVSTQTLGSGTWLAIPGISFQDTKDSAQGASDAFYTVTVLAPNAGDGLAASASGAATSSYDAGTRTLTVSGTRTDINATLANLVYTPLNSNADTTYTLTVSVDDRNPAVTGAGNGTEGSGVDGNNTVTATIDVRVSNINEGPVLNRPVDQTFVEDSKSNAIPAFSFTDADDFGLTMQVTITALHGDIDFDSHSDLTNTGGTYNSPSVTVQGTKAALNTALSHLRYSPTGNYHGSDTLTVTVNDLGNVGSNGTPLTATQSITITVTPVNDRPVATSDVTLPAIGEDISAPTGTPIDSLAFGYSDAVDDQHLISGNAADTTATLFTYVAVTGNAATAAQGIWQVSTTDSPDAGNPADWITIPITGLDTAHALVFTVDRQVRFVPAANFFGTPGALTVRLADGSANLDTSLSANAAQTRDLTTAGGLDDTGAWNAESRSIGISINGINDHVTLTEGDFPLEATADSPIEALVTQKTAELDDGKPARVQFEFVPDEVGESITTHAMESGEKDVSI